MMSLESNSQLKAISQYQNHRMWQTNKQTKSNQNKLNWQQPKLCLWRFRNFVFPPTASSKVMVHTIETTVHIPIVPSRSKPSAKTWKNSTKRKTRSFVSVPVEHFQCSAVSAFFSFANGPARHVAPNPWPTVEPRSPPFSLHEARKRTEHVFSFACGKAKDHKKLHTRVLFNVIVPLCCFSVYACCIRRKTGVDRTCVWLTWSRLFGYCLFLTGLGFKMF